MTEEFKQITDYPDYLIGNKETVISNKRKKAKVMNDVYGYPRVSIRNSTKKWVVSNHRLVALMFVDNPNPILFDRVNHKDCVITNNDYRNLEWCSHQLNMEHAKVNGRIKSGENCSRALLTNQQVIELREELIVDTVSNAAKRWGLRYDIVYDVYIRRSYKHV
jgi:hypothetical protein